GFQAAALHQADGGIGDCFGCQAMGGTRIETEHVTSQMGRADLAPAVAQELVGANRAADYLVDILGRLAFAVDFLVLAVGKFGGDHARTIGEDAELVGRRRNRNARGVESVGCRGGDCLGMHVAISSMRDGLVYRGYLFSDISVDILREFTYGVLRGCRISPDYSPLARRGARINCVSNAFHQIVFEIGLQKDLTHSGGTGLRRDVFVWITRNHDDRRADVETPQPLGQLQPVDSRHFVVDNHAVRAVPG